MRNIPVIALRLEIAYHSPMEQPYTPDPFKNFTPRENPVTTRQPPAAAMDVDLSGLTDDDLRQECRESLVLMMRKARGDLKALGAVRELLDRIDGKPVQKQAVDMRMSVTGTITHEARIKQADEEADRMMKLVYERNGSK